MRRGTTPTLLLSVPGRDLSTAKVYVTVRQDFGETPTMITKSEGITSSVSNSETILAVRFSQEETLLLRPGKAYIQAKWVFPDGFVEGTDVSTVAVTKILNEEEIAYA